MIDNIHMATHSTSITAEERQKFSEEIRQVIDEKYHEIEAKASSDYLQDHDPRPHVFVVFQDEDDMVSNFKILKDISEVKEYIRQHDLNKHVYGTICMSGGFGHGKITYFPLYLDDIS